MWQALETITNWIVITGAAILLSVIIASWLASYRVPKAAPVRSGDWFFALPVWAQIVGGLVACAIFAYLGCRMWISLPLAVSPDMQVILRIVGLALFLAGWVLVLWARWVLGALYGVSTSCAAPLQVQHRLIQHGPYAFVRHSLYLGYLILLLGVALPAARYRMRFIVCLLFL